MKESKRFKSRKRRKDKSIVELYALKELMPVKELFDGKSC